MIKEKLVSIVVPIYNAYSSLEACIESILSQTYPNLEIILVDDGSTDKSRLICERYVKRDKRIQYIYQKNQGVSKARNFGIQIALGDYICFIDSDDFIQESYVEYLLQAITSYNVDIVQCNYKSIYRFKNNKVKGRVGNLECNGLFYIDSNLPKSFFINGYIHPCWGKIYKSSIIKQNNILFPLINRSEDTIFNIQYIKNCKSIYLIDKPLYYYIHNQNEESLSDKIETNIFNIYKEIYDMLFEFFKDRDYKLEEYLEIISYTMYPQFYNAIVKLLRNKSISFNKKKELLNEALNNKEILNLFKTSSNSIGEIVIKQLIKKKMYVLLFLILNFVIEE